jgi:uncharacterized protein (TIGR00290 family)
VADQADAATERALALAWSGGKDAALALDALIRAGHRPGQLLTTVVGGSVPHHRTPVDVIEAQARAVGLPLVTVEVPQPFDAERHSTQMRQQLPTVRELAFGDLFLEDLRRERENTLERVGVRGSFPVWGSDTGNTARRILDAGIRALIVAVDTTTAPSELLGHEYDLDVIEQLEALRADPCGENGEIHTVVFDAPVFDADIRLVPQLHIHEGRFAHLTVAVGHLQDTSWMPPRVCAVLDRSELATLTRCQTERLLAAQHEIGWPLLAYQPGATGRTNDPCDLLHTAQLDDARLQALHALEAELELAVVAYTHDVRSPAE